MHKFFTNYDDRKMITISGLTLTVLMVLTGFSVYKIMQSRMEALVFSNFQTDFDHTVKLIGTHITHAMATTQAITRHIALTQNQLSTYPDAYSIPGIAASNYTIGNMPAEHLSAIRMYDANGKLLLSSGAAIKHSHYVVQLDTDPGIESYLIWNGQFILRNSAIIRNADLQELGRIVTEAPLTVLTGIFSDAAQIGKTDEFSLCVSTSQVVSEIGCFQRNLAGIQFKHWERRPDNSMPLHFAMEAQQGIQLLTDDRQNTVVAVHAPVSHGIGVVLKMDESEMQDHLSNPIPLISLFLVVWIVSGIAILRWLTSLFATNAIHSHEATSSRLKQLAFAQQREEKISPEFEYVNAIGKLAAIFIVDSKGDIVQVNDKLCEISGYTREELIGKNHRILCAHQRSCSLLTDLQKNSTQNEMRPQEICNRHKSGELYWVETITIPWKNVHGKIDCYLFASVDIAARKQKDLGVNERLKENHCLQMIRNAMRQELSTEELCQLIVESLMLAMQFPELTVAIIELGSKQIAAAGNTGNHPSKISAKIISNGETCGVLEVAYQQNLSFLPQEQHLVDAIAHDLGRWYERKEAEQRILQMTTHDALTGLPNRQLLQDRIEQALAQDSRNPKVMAVLFINLDHFKMINDSLGHDIGDLLLKAVAERLLACVRNEDTVARQGGDEFIVVLNSIAESLDAAKVAQKILDALTRPYPILHHELHIGGSIGIAVFPNDGTNAENLLKNSDVAMYHAKENGRNNYQFFTHELNKSAHERHMLSLDLRHALERNELVLFYQPVMDMPENRLHSVEALLRWQHPQQQLIAPDKFIGLAEETGLIIPIGEWVIKTVCLQIKAWKSQGYSVPRVAINLSGRQFRDKSLIKNISRILEETGTEARYITLEITESMLIDDIEKVVETLKCLSDMGIHISIDDFGTGYSSLSYLKRFPIHTLKIDRSFVRDIVTDKNDHTIVAAIIAMAHSLEIEVIAEGIETAEQLQLLMTHHCNHYQGYFFSRPVPVTQIKSMLQKSITSASKIHAIR